MPRGSESGTENVTRARRLSLRDSIYERVIICDLRDDDRARIRMRESRETHVTRVSLSITVTETTHVFYGLAAGTRRKDM